ncbi:MAG: hypothetical protein IKC59_02085 [Clostridia bacterium]|nr:hypothetical protein [Clostridia bacterium]
MPKSDQRVGKSRWNKIGSTVKKWVMLLLNPRFLLCFGIGWMITNGWAYLMLGLGLLLDASWAIATASAYLALLWIPMTPEKIITVAIAILLLRKLFPNDEKTLGVLRDMFAKVKQKRRKKKLSVQSNEETGV